MYRLPVNANKIEYTRFKQKGTISTLNGNLLKLVDLSTYNISNIPFTESNVILHFVKTWNAIDKFSII